MQAVYLLCHLLNTLFVLLQITKEPTEHPEPVSTELSFINSFGSNHSDLSDGVPL